MAVDQKATSASWGGGMAPLGSALVWNDLERLNSPYVVFLYRIR